MDMLSIPEAKLSNACTRYFHSTTKCHTWNHINTTSYTKKSLTADRLEALLQMQKTDPFCKWISKHLSNGKHLNMNRTILPCQRTPIQTYHRFQTEVSCSSHIKILDIYSFSGSPWQVRTSGKYPHLLLDKVTILLEGNEPGIWKYIANCTLCCREKAKIQNYHLQMMEIPNRPFDKIVMDLITECETSNIWKQTHSYYYWSLKRMARGIPYTGQVSRHNSFNFHQQVSTSTYVP